MNQLLVTTATGGWRGTHLGFELFTGVTEQFNVNIAEMAVILPIDSPHSVGILAGDRWSKVKLLLFPGARGHG